MRLPRSAPTSTFDAACAAIGAVLPRFTALLREHHSASGPAVGSWTLPDVACHVSHVIDKDTDALRRRDLPDVALSPADVAVMTNSMLAEDPERDLAKLADRIDSLGAAFLELRADPPREPVTWIGGTQLPSSAVACHLLEEVLVHGHDAAAAAHTQWRIEPEHAVLAITGAAVPIIAASPQSFVRPGVDPSVRARVQVRLRGFNRFTLALGDGLHAELPPLDSRADAFLSADPSSLLLVMLGRQSQWRPILRGKLMAWGRRPQALLTLLRNISPP
jgi:hypothetical protein